MHNHQSTSLHLTVSAIHDTHMTMSMGFGAKSNESSISKREEYNDEYFTDGGIDFTSCFDNQDPHYTLNTGSDYSQMDRDIQCYFPDLSNAWGAEVQIFDASKRVTIGSGSIAAFRGSDHASSIRVMPGCPVGVSPSTTCEAAYRWAHDCMMVCVGRICMFMRRIFAICILLVFSGSIFKRSGEVSVGDYGCFMSRDGGSVALL